MRDTLRTSQSYVVTEGSSACKSGLRSFGHKKNSTPCQTSSIINKHLKIQGPVVQSIVSSTSSLRGQLKCFMTLLPNTLIFLLKNERSFTHFLAGSRSATGRASDLKSGVLGSIPGLATHFRFSFRFFKKGSCQLLAKVCARSTG